MTETIKKLNTIGKAVSIVEAIRIARRPLSIKEISEAVGFNKSSLHHHIKSLTEFGYLQQHVETRKYDIGMNLVRAGQAYLQRVDVRERGHQHLEQLSQKLNETVHMLILDNEEAAYVDKVDVNHQPGALQCSSFIGQRTDLYSTAAGKILLSNLEQTALQNILEKIELKPISKYTITQKDKFNEELALTKERGYALDLQEHSVGLQCIAVPILNLHCQCVAAISVSCPIAKVSTEALESHVLSHLQETGHHISKAMGYIPVN